MKPIIFSTAEVNEILSGNKVQFRKPVKNLKIEEYKAILKSGAKYTRYTLTNINRNGIEDEDFCFDGLITNIEQDKDILAYATYKIGDILYVKESWRYGAGRGTSTYEYKTDMTEKELEEEREEHEPGIVKWKSPVTMPREAARYFLKVKDVKVQKLREVTKEDVLKGGLLYDKDIYEMPCNIENARETYLKGCFMRLWNKKYKKKGYGWDRDPWIWMFEFEMIEKE